MDDKLLLLLGFALVGGVVFGRVIKKAGKAGGPDRELVFRASSPFLLHAALRCFRSATAVAENPRFFLLAMSAVDRIDASGLHCLRLLYLRCRQSECTFVLFGLRDAVLDRLQRAGLDAEIGRSWIFADYDSAQRALDPRRLSLL